MSPEEYDTTQRLARCSFYPGSWAKRFSRNLAALPQEYELSAKQIAALWSTAWHYRRQIGERYARPPGAVSSEVGSILKERGWRGAETDGGVLVTPPNKPNASPSITDLERLRAWNAGEKL